MNILDFDEAQGLTAEMVRKHIAGLGYAMRKCPEFPVCKSLGRHTHQGGAEGVDFAIADAWEGNERAMRMLDCSLHLLASIVGLSLQSLLREINPRMREGRPSPEALAACPHWLVQDIETGELQIHHALRATEHVSSVLGSADFKHWRYWPCDAHGNKLRWPERDG